MFNNSLGGLKFGIDENGNYGYIKVGADTVTPFKKGGKLIAIGKFSDSSSTLQLDNGNYLACITGGIGAKLGGIGNLGASFNCTSTLLFESMYQPYNDGSYAYRSKLSVYQVIVTNNTLTISPQTGQMTYAIISAE